MGSALRSLAFALFQIIVTPLYALAVFAAGVAAAGAALPLHHRLVCAEPVGRALALRHSASRDRLENVPATRAHRLPASTARRGRRCSCRGSCRRSRTSPRRSCCRCRSSAGRFALASPITIDRTAGDGRDGADRRRRAASASRRASGSSSIPKARASRAGTRVHYKTRRRAPRHRDAACRSCRSRTTRAGCGRKA